LSGRLLTVTRRIGLSGETDWDLMPRIVDGDFTLVTNNARDFRKLCAQEMQKSRSCSVGRKGCYYLLPIDTTAGTSSTASEGERLLRVRRPMDRFPQTISAQSRLLGRRNIRG
jgi:hypothetical protein